MHTDPNDPSARRWRRRERLWAQLTCYTVLTAHAEPARPGYWLIFDPADDDIPLAVLTGDELHDLTIAGVRVVYRR